MLNIINYEEGMEISEPCIIRGMPNEIYHKMPALSNSGLKTLIDCPAKYYYKYLSGECENKEKPSYKIGKACHMYLLEGREAFEKVYWHNPFSEYTKEALISHIQAVYGASADIKKWLKPDLMTYILEKENIIPGQIHLTKSELNQIVTMAKAIRNHTQANNALSQNGESELSLFWQDEITGVWLKCRPDFLPYDCKNVPDFKTADSANPRIFPSNFLKYGYHIQSAMYRMGIKAVCGIDVENFFFLVQEKEAPYITQIFNPDMIYTVWGEKAIYNGINKFLECRDNDIWPTYSDKIIEMKIEQAPDDLIGLFDKENAICYSPVWIDKELLKYEV